jgi:hypothetical protein
LAEVVESEFFDGEGGGAWPPGVEVFGVVGALVGVEGLGRGWDVAEGAGAHEGVGAAGREDGGVVVAVEAGLVVAVGEEGGFDLGFDPGFAGGGFSELGFEGVFLVVGEAASTVGARERREGRVVEGARGHAGAPLERGEMAVGSLDRRDEDGYRTYT